MRGAGGGMGDAAGEGAVGVAAARVAKAAAAAAEAVRRCRGAALGGAGGGACGAPLAGALEKALDSLASARAAAEEAERRSGAGDLVRLDRLENYITSLEQTVGARGREVDGLRTQVAELSCSNCYTFDEGSSLEISEATPAGPGTPPRDEGWLSPAEALDLYALVENERVHKERMALRAQALCQSMKDLVRLSVAEKAPGGVGADGRGVQATAVRNAIRSLQDAAEASVSEEALTEGAALGRFSPTAPRSVGSGLTQGLSSLKAQLAALTCDAASSKPPREPTSGVLTAGPVEEQGQEHEVPSPPGEIWAEQPSPAQLSTPAALSSAQRSESDTCAPPSPGSPQLPLRTPPQRISRRKLWADKPAVRVHVSPTQESAPGTQPTSKFKAGLAGLFGVGVVLLVHTLDKREQEALEDNPLWGGRG